MGLDNLIKKRHSVRRFTTKKPDWRIVIEAIDAARQIPLAGNLSTLRFILVDDEEKIEQLSKACVQDFVGRVDYIVVVCSDTKQIKRSYNDRGLKYAKQQAGAAVENFLLKITELGLATCWVGAFNDEEIKRILQMPEDVDVEALLPVGYEMPPKGKQRRKPDMDNILFFNQWKNKYMKPLKMPESR